MLEDKGGTHTPLGADPGMPWLPCTARRQALGCASSDSDNVMGCCSDSMVPCIARRQALGHATEEALCSDAVANHDATVHGTAPGVASLTGQDPAPGLLGALPRVLARLQRMEDLLSARCDGMDLECDEAERKAIERIFESLCVVQAPETTVGVDVLLELIRHAVTDFIEKDLR